MSRLLIHYDVCASCFMVPKFKVPKMFLLGNNTRSSTSNSFHDSGHQNPILIPS